MIIIQEQKTKNIPGGTSLNVSFPYNKLLVDIIKDTARPGIYDSKTKTWEVPCNCLARLIELFCKIDDIQLNLLPYKEEKAKEPIKYELSNYKTHPFSYQEEGIQFGLNHDRWLLLDSPGLGKSLQIIYLAKELKEKRGLKHCLIICGINTLKFNWAKEIEKHSDLSYRILGQRTTKTGKVRIGSVAERIEDLNSTIDEFFIITNIETIRDKKLYQTLNKNKNNIDMIVVDECHKAKSVTSQQGRHLLGLKFGNYRIGLTGTLLTNTPLDAYAPLAFIKAEKCNYTNFKYYYCVYGGTFNNELIGYRNLNQLKEQIESCSLRRTKDLLDLPEKTIINEYVEMEPAQQQFYKNITEGVVDQIDKIELNLDQLLSIAIRFRQASACPSILTTENIPSAKLDRAVDLIEQITYNNDKVVVFSVFKSTLNYLSEMLKEYKPLLCTGDVKDVDISNNIDMFQNDDEHKVMLCTAQKMGTGITLTRASYAIFIDVPWTHADYEQCQDRIHRIGSKKPVFIYHLITKDTFDEHVLEIVEDKEALSNYMIDNKISKRGLEILKKYVEELK